MLKSIESEPPVTYLGSRRKSLLSKTLLAFAGWIPLGEFCPGIITPPLTAGSGGTVMWLPSTPMRKLGLGLPPPAHVASATPGVAVPPAAGGVQKERSPNPIPNGGVRKSPTPFFRSKDAD